MSARTMLIAVALLALAAPDVAAATAANGPVGWVESLGGGPRRWVSRGLTDFTATEHSTRVGHNGVYSPSGARWATLLGTREDRLSLLDDRGDVRGTLVTSLPLLAHDVVSDWSPNGRHILLWRTGDRTPEHGIHSLVLMNVATGAERTIPTGNLEPRNHPGFTPDSAHVVFSSPNWGQIGDKIFIVGLDGSDLHKLPIAGRTTWNLSHPRVSPDGRRVAFVKRDWVVVAGVGEERLSIMTADLDGGNLETLTGGHRDDTPVWSPDGNYLAFVRDMVSVCGGNCGSIYDVWVMRRNGAAQFDLSARPGIPGDPSWQPVRRPGPWQTAGMSLQPAAVPLALRLGQLVPLNFTCPRGDRTCSGVLQLRSEAITIASRHYRVRAGHAALLRLRIRALTPQLRQDDHAARLRIVAHARGGPQPAGGSVQLKAPSDLSVTCPRELLPGRPAIISGDATPGGVQRARAAAVRQPVALLLQSAEGRAVDATVRAAADGSFRVAEPLEPGIWTAIASSAGDSAHLPGRDGCTFRVREAPVAFIDTPAAGASISTDAPVALTGRAFDDDDLAIGDPSLVWKVDGTEVARGAGASVRIPAAGRHTIRLEATDPRGQTGFAEVSVDAVAPPAPTESSSSSSSSSQSGGPPQQQQATSLKASCDPGKSTFPAPVQVSGTLSPAFAGATIRIVYTREGAPPQEQPGTQTTTTAADGTWNDSYKPPTTGNYTVQAFYDGDSGHAPSQAPSCAWTVEK